MIKCVNVYMVNYLNVPVARFEVDEVEVLARAPHPVDPASHADCAPGIRLSLAQQAVPVLRDHVRYSVFGLELVRVERQLGVPQLFPPPLDVLLAR